MNNSDPITRSYAKYYSRVYGFILSKIANADDATDIAQDVYVRLLEYTAEIQEESVERLIFTIARNLVNDYLRHLYIKRDVHQQLEYTLSDFSNDTESGIIARDLTALEQRKLASMPRQRSLVYIMRRFEEKSAQEIAGALQISKRTAENHLYIGVTQMRTFFRACI